MLRRRPIAIVPACRETEHEGSERHLIFAPIGQENTGDDPNQHAYEQRHPQWCHELGNEKPYGRPAPILEDEDHRDDDQDYPHYLSTRERESVPINVTGHS